MRKTLQFLFIIQVVLLLGVISCALINPKDNKPVRALHLVMVDVSTDEVYPFIDKAKKAGFNTLIIDWRNGVKFDNSPLEFTGDAWSKDDFLALVDYAKKEGFDIIPDVRLLTHQREFFRDTYPELLYNKSTYDPRKPEVYALVLPYLDEIIESLHPRALLIGHDEVAGIGFFDQERFINPGEKPLPAELFLKDVNILHEYLKKKGVETWMWGDMLISPKEFPDMAKAGINGVVDGYGKTLRDKIPKDIVICDWHYFDKQKDFPSLKTFEKEGFKVLGAAWINETTTKNFSRYAVERDASGMIATSWHLMRKKQWSDLEEVIEDSGKVFLEDFPDKDE